jgi:hypothetical protein
VADPLNRDISFAGRGNMGHQTPLDAIAAAIERANIDFPDNASGDTWPPFYRPLEECCHLAKAIVSGLEKWGYVIVSSANTAKGEQRGGFDEVECAKGGREHDQPAGGSNLAK